MHFAFCLALLFNGITVFSQVQVTCFQNLSFGSFSRWSTGGTVTISNTGQRSVSGNVIPLNTGGLYHQAIFEIEAPEGTIISILNSPGINLIGSNGGVMELELGSSNPISPFLYNAGSTGRMQVSIGGTIAIGDNSSSPPGNYSGTFYITFNNE